MYFLDTTACWDSILVLSEGPAPCSTCLWENATGWAAFTEQEVEVAPHFTTRDAWQTRPGSCSPVSPDLLEPPQLGVLLGSLGV